MDLGKEGHRPRILVTRRIPRAGLEIVERDADCKLLSEGGLPLRAELIAALREGWDGVLCTLTECIDAPAMDACPGLRVVANMAVGYDNIDLAAASARRIMVTNTPGVLTETTADLAWAAMMAAARRLPSAGAYLRSGRWKTWEPEELLGQDVYGATIGIVGFGRIGVSVARRARGFGMRVLYTDTVPRLEEAREVGATYRELLDLLREADFVTVHVPLTAQTHHLFGDAEFRAMKATAVFANTSRGPVVDQQALCRALRDGEVFAAALDVFESEPLPLDDPLLTLDNVVLLPHIGSASVATRDRMARLAAENAVAGATGRRPPSLVNVEVWRADRS